MRKAVSFCLERDLKVNFLLPSHFDHNPNRISSVHDTYRSLVKESPGLKVRLRHLSHLDRTKDSKSLHRGLLGRYIDHHVSRQSFPCVLTSPKRFSGQVRLDIGTPIKDASFTLAAPPKTRLHLISHTRREIAACETGSQSPHR